MHSRKNVFDVIVVVVMECTMRTKVNFYDRPFMLCEENDHKSILLYVCSVCVCVVVVALKVHDDVKTHSFLCLFVYARLSVCVCVWRDTRDVISKKLDIKCFEIKYGAMEVRVAIFFLFFY